MSRIDVAALWRDAAASLDQSVAPGSTSEALHIVKAWLSDQQAAPSVEEARAAQRHLVSAGLGSAAEKLVYDAIIIATKASKDQSHELLEARLANLLPKAAQLQSEETANKQRYGSVADAILSNSLPPDYTAKLTAHLVELCKRRDESGMPPVEDLRIPLYDRFEPVLHSLIYSEVEQHIRETYANDWITTDVPSRVRQWLETERYPLVLGVAHASLDSATDEAVLRRLMQTASMRFDYHTYRTVLSMRIRELFDIVVDWPDSQPALIDLKTCLSKVEGRKQLCSSLRESTKRRLLHPGADTKDILDHYIRTIRALRTVDPPGVLLAIVAEPVRAYLRGRPDAIRSIMTAMMDQESLWGEDRMDGTSGLLSNEEEEDYRDPTLTWEPDPVDAPSHFRKDRNSDIVQMLTSIYDTKDVFVKEFQTLLAQRLLQIDDYDASKELRHVEILKKRFGEGLLQNCEVMLKDFADSKRIDHNIQERAELKTEPAATRWPIHPTILSKLFWPSLASADLQIPPSLEKRHQAYEGAFQKYKPDKRLKWMPTLGTVKLSIELEDRKWEGEVTVPQAIVLEAFRNEGASFAPRKSWADLQHYGGKGSESIIRNALYFWSNQGVLREEADGSWSVVERASQAAATVARAVPDESSVVASAQQEQIERMRMYWAYIQGMLTNLGVLPVDRIHDMLSKFIPDYGGQTAEQLTLFLQQMEQEGAVEFLPGKGWKLL